MVAQRIEASQGDLRVPSVTSIETEKARRYFREFVKQAWHIVEPGTVFSHNWHIDVICDHLQYLRDVVVGRLDVALRFGTGNVYNLLINMPPRAMKSLIVSVFFPAWAWIDDPWLRFLYSSYAQDLATDHSVACRRVIESDWYQERWGHCFQLAGDQNLKTKFENDHRGVRQSTSVGGTGTGKGGHIVVCLPPDEVIWTERGLEMIAPIVWERRNVRVWAHDVQTGTFVLTPIEGWHENPGAEIVEVGLSDGSIVRCTRDHRIWTRNRGWVEAWQLSSGDVLPNPSVPNALNGGFADAELPAQFTGRCRRFDDEMDVVFGELLTMTDSVGVAPEPLRDDAPRAPLANLLDRSAFDTVLPSEIVCSIGTENDLFDLIAREDGTGTPFVNRERSMSFGITDVLGPGSIFEIRKHAIPTVPVSVPDLLPFRARSDKSSHHDLMDKELGCPPIASDVEARVSLGGRCLHNLFGDSEGVAVSHGHASVAHDAAKAGNAVQALQSGDRAPLFVRHHSYAPSTYCITVAGRHNFVAGSGNGIIVANCDDPHNVNEAESEAIRSRTLAWWDKAMSTRLNNQKRGARVIVMQRVHEKDLSGHVLEQGGYDHLCLPMEYEPESAKAPTAIGWVDPRTDAGELLAPDRFGPAQIADAKRRLGSLGYAGQMQQRPAPAQGEIFHTAWWRRYDVLPPLKRLEIMLDSAFKDGVANDFSVYALWGADGMGSAYLVKVWRKRVQYPDLIRLGHTAMAWAKEHFPGHAIPLVIEDKASGQSAIQTFSKPYHPSEGVTLPKLAVIAHPVPPNTTKLSRAEGITALVEGGCVYVPHDNAVDWLDAWLAEHQTFPNGEHDDQVDTTTMAVSRLLGTHVVDLPAPAAAPQASRWARSERPTFARPGGIRR